MARRDHRAQLSTRLHYGASLIVHHMDAYNCRRRPSSKWPMPALFLFIYLRRIEAVLMFVHAPGLTQWAPSDRLPGNLFARCFARTSEREIPEAAFAGDSSASQAESRHSRTSNLFLNATFTIRLQIHSEPSAGPTSYTFPSP
jgi:hypothetical protein